MTREELISDAYLKEQQILHAAPRGFGGRGSKWAELVVELAEQHTCRTILDYGCGQGSLARELAPKLTIEEYDPAIAGKDAPPAGRFDMVVCTDVLEHIESDKIFFVLQHLAQVTGHILFVVISLVPTEKKLSDGRQAHILLRSQEWWRYQIEGSGFFLVKEVRGRDPKKDHKQIVAVYKRCAR
jgi:2-polyprenyl-3-methyl-5-hydroxy-6-metoxy-1,4-benzoquinol methylase